MLSKIHSFGICGLEAYPLTIEVDASRGLPGTVIVGLPDNAVRESRQRVRTAIRNSGYDYPPQRITVNLSPADIKKEGPAFDLPMALGILAATEQIPAGNLHRYIFLGELSLDGSLGAVNGCLSVALAAKRDFAGLVIPPENGTEAAVARRLDVYPLRSLQEVVHFLQDPKKFRPLKISLPEVFGGNGHPDIDFGEVKGQGHVKRGLEIAAAGGHNVLMIGPPGSGKSMLAKRLPTILPPMSLKEMLETTRIHSVAGTTNPGEPLIRHRPFRSPHHTSSNISLIGGGAVPRPGEITLSHNGVLFLDELPEFSRHVLETLRQPLEDHTVMISRAAQTVRFPAKFMFVASMNPCPCGHYFDPKRNCHCSPQQIERYISKISGPLLDRIDIHLEVPALPLQQMLGAPPSEKSETIRERTCRARAVQQTRFSGTGTFANAQMGRKDVERFCILEKEAEELLRRAIDELGLSARAHDKILKVSRTIADLAGENSILPQHIGEAVQYRCLDRNWWG